MEVFRAPRVSLIARPEFLEPEHLRVQWQGSASAGERLAEFAGRICYTSQHNPANRSTADYLENIKKQGHGSVLEHAVYVLLIEGISRSCSHELVRHRAGFGYSQLSQRYVDESHAAFVVPPAMLGDPALESEWEREMADAQAAYARAVEALMQRYAWIADKVHRRKVAREAARSVLPNATEVKIAACRLARHLAPVHLVRDPRIALHQRLDRAHVRRLGIRHLSFPLRLERRIAQHRRRDDKRGVRLVDVALRQLGIAEARAMSHQLVRAGARDPLNQQHVDRVLQHRAVALLLDVLAVIGGRPVRRVVLAHVADPAGELGEALSGGGAALPLHPEVLRLEELGPGDQGDARGAEDFHRGEGLGVRSSGLSDRALGSPSRRSAPPLAAGRQCRRESVPPPGRP